MPAFGGIFGESKMNPSKVEDPRQGEKTSIKLLDHVLN